MNLRRKCSEIYFSYFLQKITVDEVGVDEMGIIYEMGVDEMGSRQNVNKPF